MSETPHPDCSWRAGCRPLALTPLSVCECVHEWENVRQFCKALYNLEKRCINAVHLPFMISKKSFALYILSLCFSGGGRRHWLKGNAWQTKCVFFCVCGILVSLFTLTCTEKIFFDGWLSLFLFQWNPTKENFHRSFYRGFKSVRFAFFKVCSIKRIGWSQLLAHVNQMYRYCIRFANFCLTIYDPNRFHQNVCTSEEVFVQWELTEKFENISLIISCWVLFVDVVIHVW